MQKNSTTAKRVTKKKSPEKSESTKSELVHLKDKYEYLNSKKQKQIEDKN